MASLGHIYSGRMGGIGLHYNIAQRQPKPACGTLSLQMADAYAMPYVWNNPRHVAFAAWSYYTGMAF